MTHSKNILEFEFSKKFDDFSLNCKCKFDTGITAIFGPSGSGKSTLLNCIMGFTNPDAGYLSLNGIELYNSETKLNQKLENRNMGYVFQDLMLFPNMNVEKNINYGQKFSNNPSRIPTENIIQTLKISPLMKRGINNLSGGEMQRVALARALKTSPSILLLDEPLSALDANLRTTLITYLKSVNEQLSIPIVCISHSLSDVISFSDSIYVLREGKNIGHINTMQTQTYPQLFSSNDFEGFENILTGIIISQNSDSSVIIESNNKQFVAVGSEFKEDQKVTLVINASDILIATENQINISARNSIESKIVKIQKTHSNVLVYCQLDKNNSENYLAVQITFDALKKLNLLEGQKIYLIIKASSILVNK